MRLFDMGYAYVRELVIKLDLNAPMRQIYQQSCLVVQCVSCYEQVRHAVKHCVQALPWQYKRRAKHWFPDVMTDAYMSTVKKFA